MECSFCQEEFTTCQVKGYRVKAKDLLLILNFSVERMAVNVKKVNSHIFEKAANLGDYTEYNQFIFNYHLTLQIMVLV